LYATCAAELVLYGRALGLSHAESEDVLHDTFRALLALEAAPREPRFYLVRTFRNRALNHRRGLWRRLAREWASKAWFEPGQPLDPDEERAVRALPRLPAEQREVIVLKLWHGMTFEAIGDLLSIPANTAAGRYRYGLRKLRSWLEIHDEEQRDEDEELGKRPGWASAPGPVGPGSGCVIPGG